MRIFLALTFTLLSSLAFALEFEENNSELSSPPSENSLSVSLSRIPHFRMWSDDNDPSFYNLDQDIYDGNGYIATLTGDQVLSFSYMDIEFDPAHERLKPRLQAFMLGTKFTHSLLEEKDYSISLDVISPKIGVSKYSYEIDDTGHWELYGQVSAGLEVTIRDHFQLHLGAVYHVIGYPGETVGYGLYDYLGLSLIF